MLAELDGTRKYGKSLESAFAPLVAADALSHPPLVSLGRQVYSFLLFFTVTNLEQSRFRLRTP